MKQSKFSPPPLPKKNKNENDFIDGHEEKTINHKKESTKPLFFRAPQTLCNDLHELMALTGLSMKSLCIDMLRTEIKRKLKEMKE